MYMNWDYLHEQHILQNVYTNWWIYVICVKTCLRVASFLQFPEVSEQ
jgi:hypothetical protein